MAIRRSGLQKEVLALYRRFEPHFVFITVTALSDDLTRALRLIRTKPVDAQPNFGAYIRYTFHRNAQTISPRDINAIEHLLRLGRRQIERLEDTSVTDFQVGNEMQDWVARNPGRRR